MPSRVINETDLNTKSKFLKLYEPQNWLKDLQQLMNL